MKEFGNTMLNLLLISVTVLGGITTASADVNMEVNKYNDDPLPAIMGPTCTVGKTLFYAQLSNTHSEEKLCKVKDNEYYFFTRNGESTQIASVKVTEVKKIYRTGNSGYSKGYDFSLLTGDTVRFRAAFSNKGTVPLAGFFIFNDNVIDLDPLSIVIK